ncbi:hypothetical protein CHS0354_013005 [Potamilus streckersoni]|uniref:Cyclin-like domain-containing protein n=1 Tax=Potamilus streckersoni TaxID=2493646 RepID=A0AAE0T8D0_9BIVA|nr:hypothetical protein CHS0354_013005 [Potamilus streckersoni]
MAMEQDWWKNRMAEDIYATLRRKEQSLAMYQGHSRQLWMRQCLVNWLGVVTEQLNICATAQHLAVYLLDFFLDGLEVEHSDLYLLAITCFLLAVKFEEHTKQLPRFNTLIQLLPRPAGCIPPASSISPTIPSYTIEQYISVEHAVLQYFVWELAVPVVPHFVPYYLQVMMT